MVEQEFLAVAPAEYEIVVAKGFRQKPAEPAQRAAGERIFLRPIVGAVADRLDRIAAGDIRVPRQRQLVGLEARLRHDGAHEALQDREQLTLLYGVVGSVELEQVRERI